MSVNPEVAGLNVARGSLLLLGEVAVQGTFVNAGWVGFEGVGVVFQGSAAGALGGVGVALGEQFCLVGG